MIILRCTNDEGVVQDLPVQENLDLLLDISAIENATIGDVYGISSQEFAIPGTDLVNQFFGNLYNLGATPSVALQNSIQCQVLLDGAQVFRGKLYINSVITDQQGFTIYNSVVVNETVDFKFEIQDKLLTEYDFSRYDHNFTYANISASWSGNLLQGSIVYPFVEYGAAENDPDAPNYEFASSVSSGSNTIDNYDSPLRLEDFKPAIRAKDVVDIIFSGSSYEYTSSFFNSDYFESLYLLTTADDTLGPTNVSPVSQSAWAYNASGSQTLSNNSLALVDFDAEVVDNSNRFDLTTERYTAATAGTYQYHINVNYTIVNWGVSTTDNVYIQLRKNGGSIVDNMYYYNLSPTGSATLNNGITLVAGDYLEVEIGFNSTNVSRALKIANEIGKPSYLPDGYATYFQVKGPATLYGGTVDIAAQFPDDLKAQDFLEGLIHKFNLVVEPVPNSRNLIRIEPYETWIDVGDTKDWTDKVDRSIRFEISHPIQQQPRIINFSDEEDEDILNQYTIDNKGVVYGSYQFVSDSDLAEGERNIGKVFAATPVTGIPNGRSFIIPHLCTSSNLRERRPFKFKPRLLYNNGLQPVPQSALGIQGTTTTRGQIYVRDENAATQTVRFWNQMTTLTSVPVNYNTGQDLHFNNDRYSPYFQVTANGKVRADAYRTYWATYLNSLYDVDSRKLTCNVYLKPTEIQDIALNDKIFIDGQYYRINNISAANLSKRDSVQVELLKILVWKLKFPRRRVGGTDITLDYGSLNINGTGRYINVDTGATVDDYSTLIGPTSKDGLKLYNNSGTGSVVWDYQEPFDGSNQVSQTVVGSNRVAVGASKVTAVGNNNQVKEGSEVSLVVGSNNLIAENTSNVTVMGQNHTVSEQSNNAQILGGFGNTIADSNNQSTVVNGNGNTMTNTDYGIIINGENSEIVDSDYTTTINSHNNEVVVNGSGHAVIGLNREGAGLDLLNSRANTNWLGDTYLGGALFRDRTTLQCGDGYNIYLTGSAYGTGRHENLYILNWSGLSPGTTTINLPSATNNDYTTAVYQFQANGTFDGTTTVNLVGFSGQTINGVSTYSLADAYEGVTLTTNGSGWIVLAGAGDNQASYLSAYNTGSITTVANVSASVTLSDTDLSRHISVVSGSRITFEKAGIYDIQFSAQIVKTTATNAPIFLWIAKNGVDVAWTNTEYIVPGNANDEIVLAWNWYVEAQSNDYYQIKYVDQQGNVTFQSKTGTPGPDVPSWIVTVGSIGGGNSYVTGSGGSSVSASYAATASIADCATNVRLVNYDQPDPINYFYTAVDSTGSGCLPLGTLDLYGLYYDGTNNRNVSPVSLAVTGSITSTSDITTSTRLVSNYSSGDEGGEIFLNKPVTNTAITGGLNIDVYQNRFRIFEAGGTNRGGYFDITSLAAGAGTNLAAGGGAAFPFTGSARITGSLQVTGPVALTGSFYVRDLTESWTAGNLQYNTLSKEVSWTKQIRAEDQSATGLSVGGAKGQLAWSGSLGTGSLYVGNGGIAGSDWNKVVANGDTVFSLRPTSPLPTTGISTGSFAVSSSAPPKPYFWDGSTWNALY